MDEPTNRRSNFVREPQRLCDVGGAPDESMPWKIIASVHPTLIFSVDAYFACLYFPRVVSCFANLVLGREFHTRTTLVAHLDYMF
jgi:hypothetical protein